MIKRFERSFLLALIMVVILVSAGCSREIEDERWDYPPFIMYDGELYKINAPTGVSHSDKFVLVGTIESYIRYGMPTENFQSNVFGEGYEIYIRSDLPKYIYVKVNDDYMVFRHFDK